MNYRHAFHAGNFADVHKHVTLLALLDYLLKKNKAIFLLDTHAGRGDYDLTASEAQRGGEWQDGIGRLFGADLSDPTLRRYIEAVRTFQSSGHSLHQYPGSPLLAVNALRDIDRKAFVEKHPEEALALRRVLSAGRSAAPNTSIVEDDAYRALRAYLPPKENRGLVFIDPPFEQPDEFSQLRDGLIFASQRWPNGMYCAWYPLKAGDASKSLHAGLLRAGLRRMLVCELWLRPLDAPVGLNGSGLLIMNPPWQIESSLQAAYREILSVLSPDGVGGARVEWLAGE